MICMQLFTHTCILKEKTPIMNSNIFLKYYFIYKLYKSLAARSNLHNINLILQHWSIMCLLLFTHVHTIQHYYTYIMLHFCISNTSYMIYNEVILGTVNRQLTTGFNFALFTIGYAFTMLSKYHLSVLIYESLLHSWTQWRVQMLVTVN